MREIKKIALFLAAISILAVGCSRGKHKIKRSSRHLVDCREVQAAFGIQHFKVDYKAAMEKMSPEEKEKFLKRREMLEQKFAAGEITAVERDRLIAQYLFTNYKILPEEIEKLKEAITGIREKILAKMSSPEEKKEFVEGWKNAQIWVKGKNTSPEEQKKAAERYAAFWEKILKRMTDEERKEFTALFQRYSVGMLSLVQSPLLAKQFAAQRGLYTDKSSTANATIGIATGLRREVRLGAATCIAPNIKTVAVLPMVNMTNEVDGPEFVRHLFYEEIKKFNYSVKPEKEVKEILNFRMNITLGRQLKLTTPQEIGKTLGVDALFYGYLINFEQKITGVYNDSEVRMGWKLVDVKTGRIVWGRGIGAKSVISGSKLGRAITRLNGLNIVKADEVSALPGSKTPMKEMPGLGKWVIISKKEYGLKMALVQSLLGKVVGHIRHSYLEKETKYAIEHILYS